MSVNYKKAIEAKYHFEKHFAIAYLRGIIKLKSYDIFHYFLKNSTYDIIALFIHFIWILREYDLLKMISTKY
jgi:hypothetical protein